MSDLPALPAPDEWEHIMAVANAIAKTEFVPQALQNRPEAVAATILAGRELGVGPMQALQGISFIKGKPNYGGELTMALILRSGSTVEVLEETDDRCTVRGRRRDTGLERTVTYTLADAKKAGLLDQQNWQRQTRSMLQWRAVTNLGRFLFADLLNGLASFTDEELVGGAAPPVEPLDFDPDTGEILEAEIVSPAREAEMEMGALREQADEIEAPKPKPKRTRKPKEPVVPDEEPMEPVADAPAEEPTEPEPQLSVEPETSAASADGKPDEADIPEVLTELYDTIELIQEEHPEWREENIVRMAQTRFGRTDIESLRDLNEMEIRRILKATESYVALVRGEHGG